ncbi:Acetyltransferase YpeA [Calidithermus terrae]|uniref:Acetyltransferase YpeA n=1 Tax=Calidithermus terrae TaxID=1408545 RepID=A0A399EGI6_9DEIN|nr:GNAT family N-acetyltransferase [Calidithermus terrae]RIH83068.1 Acetyltransferase YpeA [Calidithermus terrae]
MSYRIRPFEAADYPAMVELWNLHNPDWSRTVAEERDSDAKRDPEYRFARFVAEAEGRVVGVAQHDQSPGSYHPQRFSLELYLHPGFMGRGLGKALYARLLEALEPYRPRHLLAQVRESSERGLRFARERGFSELKRDFVSTLDLRCADLSPYAGLGEKLAAEGIRLASFAELLEADPQAPHKLHELFSDFRLDIPRAAPPTPIPLDFFVRNILQGPGYDPRLFLVALEGERWVGMSCMFRVGDTRNLDLWITGVRREYRGRKIALALKVAGIRLARELGFESIRTDNDSRNAPMLAVNRKLGFVPGPASLTLEKEL